MKLKLFFIVVFFSVLSLWIFKREIGLTLLPIAININNPIAENQEIDWPIAESDLKGGKPNIILILADDLGFNDVSYYNGGAADGSLLTPHIDSLAKEGVAFLNGYAASPVCSPSRAAIMTGRYSSRYGFEFTPYPAQAARIMNLLRQDGELGTINLEGVQWDEVGLTVGGLPNEEITIAEMLKENGYYTAHIGKWHLGGFTDGMMPNDQGFDDSLMLNSSLYFPKNHPDIVNAKIDSSVEDMVWASSQYAASFNGSKPFKPGGYITDYYTDEAVKVIDNNKDRPFFLYLGHFAPHNPLQSLKKDYEKHSHMENHTLQVYAGMIEALDRSIGKIISALEKNGLTENTLIIFTSDNGGAGYIGLDNINKPYRGWKLTHFEGGMHIPFFAKWPAKIKKGMKYDKRIHHTDIFSTILGAANIEHPKEITIDGVNLIPFLNNEKRGEPHETLYWKNVTYQAIIHDNWKLMRSKYPKEKEYLYNLGKDPYEQNNLAMSEPEIKSLLHEKLNTHIESMPEPSWPQSVFMPVVIDKPQTKYEEGDELIYWPN
ncbi:sulfatase-like hydrolase/transferase [Gammaproteobacteria bacterium]|nr:sulfatase-like hydrolase/transferase [Gammaproteobacteria bacterium]MDA9010739.1 sulfatase-like hydrolase/transferase [Gammaproteobacteria bacterium]MDA9118274.1 sulfatase-like hydrolase/transferase [Gammaproteobacteria bacterium]